AICAMMPRRMMATPTSATTSQGRTGNAVVIQPPRHAFETHDIAGAPRDPEADQPQPERPLAERLIESEAEGLGEPVHVPGEYSEDHRPDDDVVKVRDQEEAVMELEVRRRNGEQHSRQAADRESHDEADRPEHRRGEAHVAAVHG